MAETTNVSKLIINYLTEEQYQTAKASGLINENELYVTDVQDSTTLDCFEELFTATAGQTLFTLTEGTYVPNQSRLTICVNGAQQPSTAYTETSSSSFTFDSGLSAGDSVIARYVNARIVSNITTERHKSTHYSGGTDPLTPSDIGVSDGTTVLSAATNSALGLTGTKYVSDALAKLSPAAMFVGGSIPAAWTATTLPSSANWYSVAYGNDMFVVVTGNSSIAAYSVDGITWAASTLPATSWWQVTYGNGKFVAVTNDSATAAYSVDGITWTASTLPSSDGWYCVTYGNGKFVALSSGSTKAAYSIDGITWTATTLPSSASWYSVGYGNGMFVAIATMSATAIYSTDGITWHSTTLPSSGSWQSVTYGNGKFVAIVYGSTVAAYSVDGITWTASTLPSSVNWCSVTYGNGKFVAIASNSAIAAYSTDGITWTSNTPLAVAYWHSIICGNGMFVAVAGGPSTTAVRVLCKPQFTDILGNEISLPYSTSFKATGTLTTAGWTGTAAPYTQDLAVTGVLESDRPRVDPVLGTDDAARALIKTAWQIATTSSNPPYAYGGKITFYAASKPTTNIPVVVSVVRP